MPQEMLNTFQSNWEIYKAVHPASSKQPRKSLGGIMNYDCKLRSNENLLEENVCDIYLTGVATL